MENWISNIARKIFSFSFPRYGCYASVLTRKTSSKNSAGPLSPERRALSARGTIFRMSSSAVKRGDGSRGVERRTFSGRGCNDDEEKGKLKEMRGRLRSALGYREKIKWKKKYRKKNRPMKGKLMLANVRRVKWKGIGIFRGDHERLLVDNGLESWGNTKPGYFVEEKNKNENKSKIYFIFLLLRYKFFFFAWFLFIYFLLRSLIAW